MKYKNCFVKYFICTQIALVLSRAQIILLKITQFMKFPFSISARLLQVKCVNCIFRRCEIKLKTLSRCYFIKRIFFFLNLRHFFLSYRTSHCQLTTSRLSVQTHTHTHTFREQNFVRGSDEEGRVEAIVLCLNTFVPVDWVKAHSKQMLLNAITWAFMCVCVCVRVRHSVCMCTDVNVSVFVSLDVSHVLQCSLHAHACLCVCACVHACIGVGVSGETWE